MLSFTRFPGPFAHAEAAEHRRLFALSARAIRTIVGTNCKALGRVPGAAWYRRSEGPSACAADDRGLGLLRNAERNSTAPTTMHSTGTKPSGPAAAPIRTLSNSHAPLAKKRIPTRSQKPLTRRPPILRKISTPNTITPTPKSPTPQLSCPNRATPIQIKNKPHPAESSLSDGRRAHSCPQDRLHCRSWLTPFYI
jgi:hypothetical protein